MHHTTFERQHVLAEYLLALFAGEDHLDRLFELMVADLVVTLRTVKPFLAAGRPDCSLHVDYVFTHLNILFKLAHLNLLFKTIMSVVRTSSCTFRNAEYPYSQMI